MNWILNYWNRIGGDIFDKDILENLEEIEAQI